jgi:dTDP-4-dehydrorhamnose reductase
MSSILVTGANGQVGQELQALAPQFPDFDFVFADLPDFDITDTEGIRTLYEQHQFKYCINCAAYTAVDKAESDAELAYKVNVLGVENLVKRGLDYGTQLIQLSTDYVYHNHQNTPFKEGDSTNPQGVYASTKLQGDEIAAKFDQHSMVIRTSWVYSTFGHNFVKTMLRLGNEREKLNVIFDQIGTPTYAYDLAKAILTIIQKVESNTVSAEKLAGVYHYSNEGVTSWYDFAKAIFRIEDIQCKVDPIETKDYPTPAKRPHFSLLNKTKIKSTFDIKIPHWEESLKHCLVKLRQAKENLNA